jgi:hypothetical protein
MEQWWNEDKQGKAWDTQERNWSTATPSTKSLAWSHPGLNPELRGEKPVSKLPELNYILRVWVATANLGTCGMRPILPKTLNPRCWVTRSEVRRNASTCSCMRNGKETGSWCHVIALQLLWYFFRIICKALAPTRSVQAAPLRTYVRKIPVRISHEYTALLRILDASQFFQREKTCKKCVLYSK